MVKAAAMPVRLKHSGCAREHACGSLPHALPPSCALGSSLVLPLLSPSVSVSFFYFSLSSLSLSLSLSLTLCFCLSSSLSPCQHPLLVWVSVPLFQPLYESLNPSLIFPCYFLLPVSCSLSPPPSLPLPALCLSLSISLPLLSVYLSIFLYPYFCLFPHPTSPSSISPLLSVCLYLPPPISFLPSSLCLFLPSLSPP